MNVLTDNDRFRKVMLVGMLVFAALSFFFSMHHTIPFWDMLGYAASVLSLSQSDPIAIHASAFADLKDYVSPIVYQELTSGSDYRSVMSADPDAFSQQIPYYKIRIFYIYILLMLTKIGFGIYSAMHLASAVFSCAALLIIYFGLRSHIHSLVWMAAPIIYYGVTSKFEVLQAGGVDAFAFFWVAITFVAYINGHKSLLPLLALSVLVRTDLVIHAGLVFGILLLTDKSNWRKIVLWGAVTLALYVWVNLWSGNYGWFTLIHFVFVSNMSATHPEIFSQYRFSLQTYLGFLGNSPHWVSPWHWLSIGSGSLSIVLFLLNKKNGFDAKTGSYVAMLRLNIIAAISLVYIVVHYLLFPAIFTRYFVCQYMFLILALLGTFSHLFVSRQSPINTHTNMPNHEGSS